MKIHAHRNFSVLFTVKVIFILLLGFFLFSGFRNITDSSKSARASQMVNPSIAVLPFVNMSGDKNQEYFSDGIAEEILNVLTKVDGLRVSARTSSFLFKDRNRDIPTIGERLNVDYVLEGSVRKDGNMVRITAQLVKVNDGFQYWADSYDRELKSVFAIQDEISRAIVNALKVKLVGGESAPLVEISTPNMEAYELYLKGRYFWNQRGEGLKKAVSFFEQALVKDSRYAYAHAGLADTYNLFGFYGILPPDEAFPKAKRAALTALEINSSIAEAHSALGMVKLLYDKDWSAAGNEFKQAIDINPHYVPARYWYALYLSMLGRFDEALAEGERAIRSDPLSIMANTTMGWILLRHRQYDLAESQLLKTVELNADFALAHYLLGKIYVLKSNYEMGINQLQNAITLSGKSAWTTAALGWAYAVSGKNNEAQKIIDELKARSGKEYIQGHFIALVYMGMGDKSNALDWLEKAFEERAPWLSIISNDPAFDSLRDELQFNLILHKVGLFK